MREIFKRLEELKNMAELILDDASTELRNRECELDDRVHDLDEYDEDFINDAVGVIDTLRDIEDYLGDVIRNVEGTLS